MDSPLAKELFALLLATSMFTSGCLSTTTLDYRYEVEDEAINSNTNGTTDVLFTMTLVDADEAMPMADLLVTIDMDEDGKVPCRSGSASNCTLSQSGADDDLWELDEVISVVETGLDICKANCILRFSVTGPEDAEIVGPTILHIS
ncbi:MAG TPA: hypothetical protein EYN46_01560 [Candidatus Poseidoniales archaeon]|nr:MAG: hypothetical protein CXX80_05750 [Euryarchaeota archaeon]HIO94033.1 hypothetical protein [Candidatus Poseidoniales archaeon]